MPEFQSENGVDGDEGEGSDVLQRGGGVDGVSGAELLSGVSTEALAARLELAAARHDRDEAVKKLRYAWRAAHRKFLATCRRYRLHPANPFHRAIALRFMARGRKGA
jgi:hypothetical protein